MELDLKGENFSFLMGRYIKILLLNHDFIIDFVIIVLICLDLAMQSRLFDFIFITANKTER